MNRSDMFDLHAHTNYSDGECTPAQLLVRAAEKGITHLAITDHDNQDAMTALKDQRQTQHESRISPVRLIPGIEFSTRWDNIDIHVLALNHDVEAEPVKALLRRQAEARLERNAEIYVKLGKAGVELPKVNFNRRCEQLGRVHIAEQIVAVGRAKNVQQAFKRFLGKRGRAYVSANWVELDEVLDAIKGSAGSAVLAHPLKYQLSRSKTKRLIAAFGEQGGDGLEVISGKQVQTQTDMLVSLAAEHGLKASLGSDFHAPNRPWSELGSAGYLPKACEPIWEQW